MISSNLTHGINKILHCRVQTVNVNKADNIYKPGGGGRKKKKHFTCNLTSEVGVCIFSNLTTVEDMSLGRSRLKVIFLEVVSTVIAKFKLQFLKK